MSKHTDSHKNKGLFEKTIEYGKLDWKESKRDYVKELSNHLGNILSTISDRKISIDDGFGLVDYFMPDIITAQDYYPFGMIMPERNWSNDDYRYGFNGMERDDEMKGSGNSLDFGARIYDSRLGRWMSVDPFAAKYSSMSPYNAFANNPVVVIDPDGREIIIVTDNPEFRGYILNQLQKLTEHQLALDNDGRVIVVHNLNGPPAKPHGMTY